MAFWRIGFVGSGWGCLRGWELVGATMGFLCRTRRAFPGLSGFGLVVAVKAGEQERLRRSWGAI